MSLDVLATLRARLGPRQKRRSGISARSFLSACEREYSHWPALRLWANCLYRDHFKTFLSRLMTQSSWIKPRCIMQSRSKRVARQRKLSSQAKKRSTFQRLWTGLVKSWRPPRFPPCLLPFQGTVPNAPHRQILTKRPAVIKMQLSFRPPFLVQTDLRYNHPPVQIILTCFTAFWNVL